MIEYNKLGVIASYVLFEGSFEIDFLEPTEDASCIMRATYKAGHPLNQKGKLCPMSPPLHLHFHQSETFHVLSGRLGLTLGWDAHDLPLTPEDGPVVITPWTPHRMWPLPGESEDTVWVTYAHPKGAPQAMDTEFFEQLLRHLSERHEAGRGVDVLQVMLMQHGTASAEVLFPRARWLGPLRWAVPWVVQAAMAGVARMAGYKALPYEARKTQ